MAIVAFGTLVAANAQPFPPPPQTMPPSTAPKTGTLTVTSPTPGAPAPAYPSPGLTPTQMPSSMPGAGGYPSYPGMVMPGSPGIPSTPANPAAPRPASTTYESTPGLPAGRLVSLPTISERQIVELAEDLAFHLEVTAGYKRATTAQAAELPPAPPAVRLAVTDVREGAERRVVRLGYVIAPRRLPQLWVQAYRMLPGGKYAPNPDADPAVWEAPLKQIIAERARIFSRLRISDLETTTIPLSYVDADAALFALRAMGYSAITDSEALSKDDSYKGEDVEAFDVARVPPVEQAPQAQAAPGAQAASPFGVSPFGGSSYPSSSMSSPTSNANPTQPRIPAIRNLPSSIALDRLPLIVKIPSAEARNMGLVGSELSPSQRDQLGLTVMPSAASPLAETISSAPAELLVIYHPAYPDQVAKLRKLIDNSIDKPARQVYIEGLVLEVSEEGLKDLGVQWDVKSGHQSFSLGSLIPLSGPAAAAFTFVRDPTQNVTPAIWAARISALVQANKAEVLSRPSVITLDNRQATIRVGTDIPVATSKDTSSANGSGRVAFSFSYIPTGILLNVRPRVSDDLTEISMLIDATVSATVPGADLQVLDPATKISLASAPTISTRRVQTYARILDNQPLIIGGLMSRNRIKTTDKVPLLGDIPFVGALFGHTSIQDDRREVIIVLTPSVVTENIRETKAQYPKDDDRFDVFNTALFKEHHRIRAEDLIDSSDIRFNARFRAYRTVANRLMERSPELASKEPFVQFQGNKVPGEFFFVTGMMYRMLDRLNAGESINIEGLKFFEASGAGDADRRPVSITQVLARYGDGTNWQSFFEKNRGRALVLTFTLSRNSTAAADMFRETTPEVKLVDCPDRATWRQILWEQSKPDERGVPRYAIVIQEPADLRRLQLAYATQNTVLNNGGVAGQVFDRFLVGRMLHLQEVTPTWERIMNAQIAQYFFLGEHFYMYFIQEHQKALTQLETALRSPPYAELVGTTKLP